MKKYLKLSPVFLLPYFAIGLSLSIMWQLHIGFWSNTFSIPLYVGVCIAYTVFVGCIYTGLYATVHSTKRVESSK